MTSQPVDIQSLHNAYANGKTVKEVIEEIFKRIEDVSDPGIFIHLETLEDVLVEAEKLGEFDTSKPLWGIPFAIKDNIDAEGMETTAACPAFAYKAEKDAFSVSQLREAGAILIGKTNLDQFATGLVGVRSPYAPPKNAVNPENIPGGSSSGSAVAVAHGMVTFALGTDTAGSGRIPAALNNIVGLKPTLGTISATGVVPACKSTETVSVFALTVDDAYKAYSVASGFDSEDIFSRDIPVPAISPLQPEFTVGVPDQNTREFFGDEAQAVSFDAAVEQIKSLGGKIVELDFTELYNIAQMLYGGAWVAERYSVVEGLIKNNPEAIHPVTKKVISKAEGMTAVDAFRDIYDFNALKRRAQPLIDSVDILCVPTAPTYYTVEQVEADPIETNSRLGTYTNFVNLMDMCGIAVPVAKRTDGQPGSVTVLGKSGADALTASLARALHDKAEVKLGATEWTLPETDIEAGKPTEVEIEIAVVGAHMSGLPLNGELTRLGSRFLRKSKTAPMYRFFSLAGGPPKRPGIIRDENGSSIELETWAVPLSRFGEFMAGIPQPLGIGTLVLETGEQVKGFICEGIGIEGATEITHHGGWRNYLASGQ